MPAYVYGRFIEKRSNSFDVWRILQQTVPNVPKTYLHSFAYSVDIFNASAASKQHLWTKDYGI